MILIEVLIIPNHPSLSFQLLLTRLSFFWSALPIVLLGLCQWERWTLQAAFPHQLIEALQTMNVTSKPTDIIPPPVCIPPMVLLLIGLGKELNKVAAGVARVFTGRARTCVIISTLGKRAVVVVVSVLHDWDDLTARCTPLIQELLLRTDNKHWDEDQEMSEQKNRGYNSIGFISMTPESSIISVPGATQMQKSYPKKNQAICVSGISWIFFFFKGL